MDSPVAHASVSPSRSQLRLRMCESSEMLSADSGTRVS